MKTLVYMIWFEPSWFLYFSSKTAAFVAEMVKHADSAAAVWLMFGNILAFMLSFSPHLLTSEKLTEVSSLLAKTGCKVLQSYHADYVPLL